MNLKTGVVYRKVERDDYPAIIEIIKKNAQSMWEFENDKTAKQLSRIYFYEYMMIKDKFFVATYRNHIVGVIITGDEKSRRTFSLNQIKHLYVLLRIKMTKEGRTNLKNLKQIKEMNTELSNNLNLTDTNQILLFYVSKNYRKNGIGTKLLERIIKEETKELVAYTDQRDNFIFMEKHSFVKLCKTMRMMEVNNQRFRQTVTLYRYEKNDR